MDRRQLLRGGALALGGLLLEGCPWRSPPDQPPAARISGLVDIHCHVFNGSDIPTVRFIKIVAMEHYPRQAAKLDIEDPDALDGLIALLTAILGRTRAPSASDELALLGGAGAPRPANASTRQNEAEVIRALEEFNAAAEVRANGGPMPAPPGAPPLTPRAARVITGALRDAASTVPVPAAPFPAAPASDAEKAYRSETDLGRYLRWFGLFTKYRYVLADDLAASHRRQGFEPLLLCPAAVDFDHWLGEHVRTSPLPEQVAVMGALGRRASGPPVHGYVGFDPLRQTYFAEGKFTDYDPLGLVRRAIRDEGFLGVKLYPPMGFRPTLNEEAKCQTYHERLVDALVPGAPADPACKPGEGRGARGIGQMLDKALAALFKLCVEEDACVLAHANQSNDGGPGYARRADPAFWLPVLRKPEWRGLRVGLAHFGHFSKRSEGAPDSALDAETSWEWTLGRCIKEAGDPPLFADVSFMTEMFGKPPAEIDAYLATFQRWIAAFDPDCRHLVFGTDWTMLGAHASYETYTADLYELFRGRLGFDRARLDRLYFGNAARFLGLRAGDGARARLLRYYARHNLPASRLPLLQAEA
jgi:hypothetical protein